MINIRVPEENDKKKILDLLNEENIKNNNFNNKSLHNSMIVCDGDKIVGYSNYIEIPDNHVAFLDELIIKSEYQGQYIGDGLIKSLLNLADKRQIKKVYVLATNENSLFFKKVGLTIRQLNVSQHIAKYIGNNLTEKDTIEVFEALLPDFFNESCKSRC